MPGGNPIRVEFRMKGLTLWILIHTWCILKTPMHKKKITRIPQPNCEYIYIMYVYVYIIICRFQACKIGLQSQFMLYRIMENKSDIRVGRLANQSNLSTERRPVWKTCTFGHYWALQKWAGTVTIASSNDRLRLQFCIEEIRVSNKF